MGGWRARDRWPGVPAAGLARQVRPAVGSGQHMAGYAETPADTRFERAVVRPVAGRERLWRLDRHTSGWPLPRLFGDRFLIVMCKR